VVRPIGGFDPDDADFDEPKPFDQLRRERELNRSGIHQSRARNLVAALVLREEPVLPVRDLRLDREDAIRFYFSTLGIEAIA